MDGSRGAVSGAAWAPVIRFHGIDGAANDVGSLDRLELVRLNDEEDVCDCLC